MNVVCHFLIKYLCFQFCSLSGSFCSLEPAIKDCVTFIVGDLPRYYLYNILVDQFSSWPVLGLSLLLSCVFRLTISLDCRILYLSSHAQWTLPGSDGEYAIIAFNRSFISSITISALILCCVGECLTRTFIPAENRYIVKDSFPLFTQFCHFCPHNRHNTSALSVDCFSPSSGYLADILPDSLDIIKGFPTDKWSSLPACPQILSSYLLTFYISRLFLSISTFWSWN